MNCLKCGAHIEETDERCPYCNSYNEKYKKPEPEKPTESAPPVSEPQVIHIYHDEPKKKRRFKISFSRLISLAIVIIIAIVMIRVACS